jgi:archaellin
LQQKALSTGQQSEAEIATNARVIEVSAVDASADSTVEDFAMQMKLAPGSDPIKLSEVTLTFNTDNSTLTLNYDNTSNLSAYSNSSVNALGVGTFVVEYLINGTNHIAGNLQRGDVVRLYWAAPYSITEGEHVRINFIPKTGTATLVEFNAPDVMSTQRVYLYP